ncbi:hypothetical protein HNR19_000212 [Nocardioides thalensis]|uniref:DUF5667 domain-containing protein n=1 Tax=Nocardioides thalensis TaxID=1914755 RepID=A0A853BWR7_9ACTN|nr:hypothetical protein [Nocardioides thalensis]
MSRRRADEFDAQLSRARDGKGPAADPAFDDLLEIVGALRSVPEVTARPEFVADLRERLVAEAAAQPVQAATRRPVDDALVARLTPAQTRGRNERRLATLLGGFAVVAATGSMAMASQAALPGDVLYPMKRAIENAQTNLQSDEAAKAETLLAHAQQRLVEVEALSERDGDVADEISSTLQDFSEQTNQATSLAIDEFETSGDEKSLQDVRTFADESMGQLTDLGDRLPDEIRPALITAAQTVRQVDSAAQQVCPTCEGGTVTDLPEFATRALTDILSGVSEDAAAAELAAQQQPPQQQRRDEPRKNVGSDNGGRQQPTEEDTVLPDADDPTDLPDDDPIGDITDGLLGGDKDGGKKPDDTEDDKGLVGDVVDGVGGLLGGLLGGN